jgi:hypothetical protein
VCRPSRETGTGRSTAGRSSSVLTAPSFATPAADRHGACNIRRSGRLCRRRGRLCMRRRWGRSVRCGPGHWSVAGLHGPARNSAVSGQNSRSVPRGGHRHPVLRQVLLARIDMGTVRRQRSQTQSGAIARPVASPEPQTASPMCSQPVMKGHHGRLEPVRDSMPGGPARGTRPRSGYG